VPAEPDPYVVLLAEVSRLDRRHPGGVERALLRSNFVLALHELRQFAGLSKLTPAENVEMFDAMVQRAVEGKPKRIAAEGDLLRRFGRWSVPEQPSIARGRPPGPPWANDRAWVGRFVRASTLDDKRLVLGAWAVAMGGRVEGDGSVTLPPLRPRQFRKLAEGELRQLLEQVRVEVREDDALALPGAYAHQEPADVRDAA
jgi:hypothetical protein